MEQRDETLSEIFEAPTDNAASLIEGGTAFNDALHGIIILGKVIRDNVIPATNGVDLGNSITLNNIPKPKRP